MLVGAVYHWGEVERFLALVQRAEPLWLLVTLLLQFATYFFVASGWQQILQEADADKPLAPLMRIAVSKLFADQAMPSGGIGGNILLVDQLIALGIAHGTASATLLLSIIGYYAAFAACAAAAFFILWLHHEASVPLASTLSLFLLVAFGIPALALWLGRGGGSRVSRKARTIGWLARMFDVIAATPHELLRNRGLIARVALCNFGVFLADSTSLWVCLKAIGYDAPLVSAFIALVMAGVVTTLGPIPMGLGSFEATSTGVLHLLGVPIEAALTATLILRFFILWLPLLPGFVLVQYSVRKRPSP